MAEERVTFRLVNNTAYGSAEVTNKYRPVGQLFISTNEEKQECSKYINRRIKLFKDNDIAPGQLSFYTQGMKDIITRQYKYNNLSPLVIVSGSRSKWIAKGFELAKNIKNTVDVNDTVGFFDKVHKNMPITPWYCPARAGKTRQIFILVHITELKDYSDNLRTSIAEYNNIFIIGWSFEPPNTRLQYRLVGFGASYCAAIEFCKYLRSHLLPQEDVNHYAWILDDNVVHINEFSSFQDAETYTANNDLILLGFQGASSAVSAAGIRDNQQFKRGQPISVHDSKEVFHQAMLWNITKLDQAKLNFSPYFVGSAENTSFKSYLMGNRIKFGVVKNTSVYKELVEDTEKDKGYGAYLLQGYRNQLQELLANSEQVERVNYQIKTAKGSDTTVYLGTLKDFISKAVLPNAVNQNSLTTNQGICHSIEFVLAEVEHGVGKEAFTTANLQPPAIL